MRGSKRQFGVNAAVTVVRGTVLWCARFTRVTTPLLRLRAAVSRFNLRPETRPYLLYKMNRGANKDTSVNRNRRV